MGTIVDNITTKSVPLFSKKIVASRFFLFPKKEKFPLNYYMKSRFLDKFVQYIFIKGNLKNSYLINSIFLVKKRIKIISDILKIYIELKSSNSCQKKYNFTNSLLPCKFHLVLTVNTCYFSSSKSRKAKKKVILTHMLSTKCSIECVISSCTYAKTIRYLKG